MAKAIKVKAAKDFLKERYLLDTRETYIFASAIEYISCFETQIYAERDKKEVMIPMCIYSIALNSTRMLYVSGNDMESVREIKNFLAENIHSHR